MIDIRTVNAPEFRLRVAELLEPDGLLHRELDHLADFVEAGNAPSFSDLRSAMRLDRMELGACLEVLRVGWRTRERGVGLTVDVLIEALGLDFPFGAIVSEEAGPLAIEGFVPRSHEGAMLS